MRTQTEVREEIKQLKALVGNIRPYTAFGEDNNRALDIQIRVLEEALTQEEVYDLEGEEEWDNRDIDMATEAIQWRDEDMESPAEGWTHLKIK